MNVNAETLALDFLSLVLFAVGLFLIGWGLSYMVKR